MDPSSFHSDSETEFDDGDFGIIKSDSVDLESTSFPACKLLTRDWQASLLRLTDVTVSKIGHSIEALKSTNFDETDSDFKFSVISVLLYFLESLADIRSIYRCQIHFQHVIGRILQPSFLSRLFEHRHVCNLTAAKEVTPRGDDSGFICWVDVAIARLGEAVQWIGGQACSLRDVNCSRSAEELALDTFMNSPAQKEQLVRVASQLPASWKATVAILGSEYISEAARRLALSLMFGAYVLSPRLAASGLDERLDITVLSDLDLPHAALQKYISNISRNWLHHGDKSRLAADSNPCGADTISKCQSAMAVSLFAHLEMSRESTEAQPSVSFRPSTLSTVIMLTEFLMNDDISCVSTASIRRLAPFDIIHQNHCRLLGWGLTIPWCWLMWGSETNVHFETVIQITVTWLQHFTATDVDIETVLQAAPLAAMPVFLSLVNQPISENITHAERCVLYKTCWSISYLARRFQHQFDDTVIAKAYQNFFLLLLSLGFDEVDMSSRRVILDFIAWVPRRLAKLALPLNHLSDTASISAIVDNAINRILGYFCHGMSSTAEVDERGRQVKASLEVLVVLAWSGMPGASYVADNQSLVAHTSSMLGKTSWWDKSTQATGIILLGCMVGLTAGYDTPTHQPILVCASVMSHVTSDDLPMAAAISVYIHGLAKPNFLDSVTLIEVWDYLRDVVVMILGKRQPDHFQILASLTRNTICSALSLILAFFPSDHVGMLINSPWTLTLYNELRSDSEAQLPDDSPPTRSIVGSLINQIENIVKQKTEAKPLAFQRTFMPARLLLHQSEDEYHFVGIAVE